MTKQRQQIPLRDLRPPILREREFQTSFIQLAETFYCLEELALRTAFKKVQIEITTDRHKPGVQSLIECHLVPEGRHTRSRQCQRLPEGIRLHLDRQIARQPRCLLPSVGKQQHFASTVREVFVHFALHGLQH